MMHTNKETHRTLTRAALLAAATPVETRPSCAQTKKNEQAQNAAPTHSKKFSGSSVEHADIV
jgi:hypothetical protein